MSELSLDEMAELIRSDITPAALQAKLKAMIEEAYPAKPAPFRDGEIMPFHEFERRFKRAYCGEVEPFYSQHKVQVVVHQTEGLILRLFPLSVFQPEMKDAKPL